MRTLAIGIIVFYLVVTGAVLYIQTKNEQETMRTVQSDFTALRQTPNGDQASKLRRKILANLSERELPLARIGTSDQELEGLVKEAYRKQAVSLLAGLRATRDNPDKAKKLRAEFLRTQRLSGRSLQAYNVSTTSLNRIVARNFLGAAQKEGVRLTAADFRAAGLPVPVIVKRVPMKTHRANLSSKRLSRKVS